MILVTGGTGNIGSCLALALKSRGDSVRVFGLPDPRTETRLSREGVEILHGDVNRTSDLEKACMGARTVYHLAGILSSPENPSRFREINTTGTERVLKNAEICGASHFILVSSISVTYPRLNAYSRSKLEAETRVRQSRIPWTIARPCLVLDGLGGGDEYRAFAQAIRKFALFRLPNSGKALKRPIHLDDLAEALAGIHENPVTYGKTYALGGLDTLSLNEIAGRKSQGIIPVPTTFLRIVAGLSEIGSRLSGRRISRITHQSLDGLVFDAAPEIKEAQGDLNWSPLSLRNFSP